MHMEIENVNTLILVYCCHVSKMAIIVFFLCLSKLHWWWLVKNTYNPFTCLYICMFFVFIFLQLAYMLSMTPKLLLLLGFCVKSTLMPKYNCSTAWFLCLIIWDNVNFPCHGWFISMAVCYLPISMLLVHFYAKLSFFIKLVYATYSLPNLYPQKNTSDPRSH